MQFLHVCCVICVLIGLIASDVIDLKETCKEDREILTCAGQGVMNYEYSLYNDAISRLVFEGLVGGAVNLKNLPSVEAVFTPSSDLSCGNLQGFSHDIRLYVGSGKEILCSHVDMTDGTTPDQADELTTMGQTSIVAETISHEADEPTTETPPIQITEVFQAPTLSPPTTSNPSTIPDSPPTVYIIIITTLIIIIIILIITLTVYRKKKRVQKRQTGRDTRVEEGEMIELQPAISPSTEPNVNILSSVGGLNLRDNVKKIMEKLMKNDLMSKFNLVGGKQKRSIKSSAVFGLVMASAMKTKLEEGLTKQDVKSAIQTTLKYAPDRWGVGGRKANSKSQRIQE